MPAPNLIIFGIGLFSLGGALFVRGLTITLYFKRERGTGYLLAGVVLILLAGCFIFSN